MTVPDLNHFLCSRDEILDRVNAIDPTAYAQTRNYLDGAVTWLSPFITHGIINTSFVAQHLLRKYSRAECEKLLFELAWQQH